MTMKKTLVAVAVSLMACQAHSAGFQLNSQSATGIGRAFSGDAVIADNASVLARNPAAMALFDSAAFSGGLSYAEIQVDVDDARFSRNGRESSLGGMANAADSSFIPNLFYIQPINDTFAIGFGAFSNFGTGTDLSDMVTPGTVDLLGETFVSTVNLNTSLSMRVNENLSLGAGIDVVYGAGELTRKAQNPLNGDTINALDVDADGVGYGGILGATYEFNKDHRIGVSYRFSPTITAKGDVFYAGNEMKSLDVKLPDIFQIAGFHQLTDRFAMHYTAQWTQWSTFDKITMDTGAGDATLKDYNWKDSWFLSVGGTYNLTDKWTLRAGYAYDQGIVDELQSVSFPDSDRQWYTAGVGYQLTENSTIDLGVAFVRGEATDMREAGPGGDVYATTESNATYYSVQYSYRF